MLKTRYLPVFLIIACFFPLSPVMAKEALHYGRIHLSAKASQAVENNLLTVRFEIEKEHENPAEIANSINKQMQKALRKVNAVSKIDAQTGQYSINAIYGKNRFITHWRGRQSLTLQSESIESLSGLIMQLQNDLNLKQLAFAISPAKRDAVETSLSEQAIQNFRTKAQAISQSLGAKGYRLVKLHVDDQGNMNRQPPHFSDMSMHRSAPGSHGGPQRMSAQPALSQGKSELTISVNGEIELIEGIVHRP